MRSDQSPTLVVVCQVYPPDPTAVGQHVADVAERMHSLGWRVVVLAAAGDYENPSVRYPSQRRPMSVQVWRLPLSSFGKRSIIIRLAAQVLFTLQAVTIALTFRRIDSLLVSTSPPFAGFAGALLKCLRRTQLTWWIMDLNPDQMVRMGKLRSSSIPARVFDWMNRFTLRRADNIIVLDSYMKKSVLAKSDPTGGMHVIPPWAPADFSEAARQADSQWRTDHVPEGVRVVMYSGNHGFANPLDTLLEVAGGGSYGGRLFFLFVGGGTRKPEVEQRIAEWPCGCGSGVAGRS